MCHPYVGRQDSGNPLIVLVIGPCNFKGGRVWRFRCQRLPAPALISPLIDYVPHWIALLCLVVCIARRCQTVSSFVPGGCCVALQMLMRAGVPSWIKSGERFRSLLGSVVTHMFCQINFHYITEDFVFITESIITKNMFWLLGPFDQCIVLRMTINFILTRRFSNWSAFCYSVWSGCDEIFQNWSTICFLFFSYCRHFFDCIDKIQQ